MAPYAEVIMLPVFRASAIFRYALLSLHAEFSMPFILPHAGFTLPCHAAAMTELDDAAAALRYMSRCLPFSQLRCHAIRADAASDIAAFAMLPRHTLLRYAATAVCRYCRYAAMPPAMAS